MYGFFLGGEVGAVEGGLEGTPGAMLERVLLENLEGWLKMMLRASSEPFFALHRKGASSKARVSWDQRHGMCASRFLSRTEV